jgi:beta-lactamase superfamily II metal-dependent hydrolase
LAGRATPPSTSHTALPPALRGALNLVIYSVGTGQCVIAQCPNGNTILNDCGSIAQDDATPAGIAQATADFNRQSGGKYIVLSHGDADHINLVGNVVGTTPVARFYLGGQQSQYTNSTFLAWAEAQENKTLPAGQTPDPADPTQPAPLLTCGSNAGDGVYVLAANAATSKNDQSIVLRYQIGKFSAITMGDAESGTEQYMLSRFQHLPGLLKSTVLVAAHHGSDNNANTLAWATANRPNAVVFSAGRRYGHPRCASVINYEEQEALVDVALHEITCWTTRDDDSTDDTPRAEYNTYNGQTAIWIQSNGVRVRIYTCAANNFADNSCVKALDSKVPT